MKRNKIISWLMCSAASFAVVLTNAYSAPQTFRNPIIPGFAPDPTITRAGDDYYLANSSFEFFPSVPIYHSKDLVNWQLISYAVSDPEYLPELAQVDPNRGIYAPTLRYHDGLFYLITTCVQCGNNFYVTAKDPKGPWSKPIWVEGDRGIDPDLFWDDDGKVYYSGTGILDKSQAPWDQANGIWIQQIDLESGKLLGQKTQLTFGHAAQAHYTEGPHIYKVSDGYMLLVAEGGTGSSHAVSVFKSKDVTGPYIPFQNNPVMTHRNMGNKAFIHTTGHADLIQTQNGEWWSVMLAKRNFSDFDMLARESYLTKVEWENGWPVFNAPVNRILETDKRPDLPWTPLSEKPVRYDFEGKSLDLEFNFLRNPTTPWYQVEKDQLAIDLRPETGDMNKVNPSMVLHRIRDLQYVASTKVTLKQRKNNEAAGLVVYRNKDNWYQFVVKGEMVELSYYRQGKLVEVASKPFDHDTVVLKVISTNDIQLWFSFGENEHDLQNISAPISADATSDNIAQGFNGPYVGMYATSQQQSAAKKAYFDWFDYKGLDE